MTKQDLSLIGILVDRSGSMDETKEDMTGGIKSLIKDQASQPGEAVVTLAQFDTAYEIVYPITPIKDVPKYKLVPRGATALLDAMGRFIQETGIQLAAMPEDERPGVVVIVIVTDGLENSSKEWKREQVKSLVEQQTNDYNWKFIFLGANMDAVAEAGKIGIAANTTMDYAETPDAMSQAYASTSNVVSAVRGGNLNASFTDKDRKEAVSPTSK